MITEQVSLTETESELLQSIVERTGMTRKELIHEGVGLILARFSREHHLELLRRGRGIWKDRTDLPSLEELREESNRHGT